MHVIYVSHVLKFIFKAYQKNILKNLKRRRKEARERYQNLSEEEKDEIREKLRERYQNFTEEEKEKRSILSGALKKATS